MYRLHYLEKIREDKIGSALVFGAALDSALNSLLLKQGNPEEIFNDSFREQKYNKETISIPTSEKIVYLDKDFDNDLLTETDVKSLEEFAKKCGIQGYTDHLSTYKGLKNKEISGVELQFYNYANWLCLYRKGLLMIEAYRQKVMPLIKKVYEVQKEFSLPNADGDTINGFVDLIVDLEGHGLVILDNKTASMPYDKLSARNSEQLALYLHVMEEKYNTRKIGYVVLLKNVKKNKVKYCTKCGGSTTTSHTTCNMNVLENTSEFLRCGGTFDITMSPEISVQIIVDEMPEENEAVVLQNMDTVNELISKKTFDKNTEKCHNQYGKKCVYFNYCHGNKDMKGLKKL